MKSKKILRFYFGADSLERALDNLIFKYACDSANCGRSGEYYADKIIGIISAKQELGGLWGYLDGRMAEMGEGERETLGRYAAMRCGIKNLPESEAREIRRCLIKFKRKATAVERYKEGLRLVKEYYCLL